MSLVSTTPEKQIVMPKRERVQLKRLEGDRNRVTAKEGLTLWYDSRRLKNRADMSVRLSHTAYNGLIVYLDNFEELLPVVGGQMLKVIHLANVTELETFLELPARYLNDESKEGWVVSSDDLNLLNRVESMGIATCYRTFVDDGDSLHQAIVRGSRFHHLMVSFQDPTNIPLELVIASLQATRTVLIKEILTAHDADDALVTLGVMEVGADGVAFSPEDHLVLDSFLAKLSESKTPKVTIDTATILRTAPVGMGYRSCIDLATLFSPTEGMLVGSTSQGGILCCPEVFFLPYMELRPFRVNAGAVHSYVYNLGNRTDYMTELRAGAPVMIADTKGKVRRAAVGRMKTEVRPLRLIEAQFGSGQKVNVLMQDDWHVRIFSDAATPLNITELKPGDKILGHVAEPGRHVGIKVDENIVEC